MTTLSLERSPPTDLATPPPPSSIARARVARGSLVAVAAGLGAFLLMAHDARLTFGVPLGAVAVSACAWGMLDALCAFVPAEDAALVSARDLARPVALTSAAAGAFALLLAAAVHAVVPQLVAGTLAAAAFCAFCAGLFAIGVALGPLRHDEEGRARPLHRRHGFWLLCALAFLYFPALGVGSLTDPWETHYGEVAREVLARDDWVSLWWSWQGFFYSKPVLGIWAQAIAMAVLGVHVEPDRMLAGSWGRLAHPEWAVRAPFALFAIAGVYLLYKGASRWFGRRAALLGALALATCPQWFLVAHQTMTDMPYVASIAAAIGLVLLAAREDDTARARTYVVSLGRMSISIDLWHLVTGAVFVCVVPQLAYLVSRNVELVLHASGPHGFRLHLDEVRAGSGLGNCGEPGDPACTTGSPWSRFEPWEQALVWAAMLAGYVLATWRERRTKRLLYLAAWLAAALATMAKGPAGLVLPAGAVFAWIAATRRWEELPRMAIGAGVMIALLVVGPWFVAMLVRHGPPFTDELIFHDMFDRAFEHVHDTNAGADTSLVYYVRELGYGMFPWTALVPLGLFAALRRARGPEGDAATLLVSWFLLTFGLFTIMGTKFHHYILPAVPPAAMLAGLALDSCLAKKQGAHARVMLGAASLAGALLLGLVARDLAAPPGSAAEGPALLMRLFAYRYDRGMPASLDLHAPILGAAIASAAILLLLVVPRLRRVATVAWTVLALAWAAWGLDAYMPQASYHWGQRGVMDAYYAQRTGPDEPIVAYQMNWKGENFYTGNRIPQFGTPEVPSGTPKFSTWVQRFRDERVKGHRSTVAWFVTERGRVAGLRSELQPKALREVTGPEQSNQFVLVRAEL